MNQGFKVFFSHILDKSNQLDCPLKKSIGFTFIPSISILWKIILNPRGLIRAKVGHFFKSLNFGQTPSLCLWVVLGNFDKSFEKKKVKKKKRKRYK